MNKIITIADLSAWLGLSTTRTRGLSFRAILAPGILVTSSGEVSTPDHLKYLSDLGLGSAGNILVVKGDHPIEALLNERNQVTLARIIDMISSKGYRIEFFETGKHDAEQRLVEQIACHLDVTPRECWETYTCNNHPELAYLGSKADQRQLVREQGVSELFAPHKIVRTQEALRQAVQRFEQDGPVMVRLDGEASSDCQYIYPDEPFSDIWWHVGDKKAAILVEPFYADHTAIGALLRLTDHGVEFVAVSDQLTVKSEKSGKPVSYGNFLLTSPAPGTVFTPAVFAKTKALSEQFGELLRQQGVRGCLSVDLLLLEDDQVFITEANIRMTNGWYGYHALCQLRNHLLGPMYVGLNVFKPGDSSLDSFSTIVSRCREDLYTKERCAGFIPVVTTILPTQCHLLVSAPTVEEYQRLIHKLWHDLSCGGMPPKVFFPEQVASRIAIS